MGAYFNLDPDGLQELRRGSIIVIIDVRTDREIERGMIPGAMHIPLHMLPARLGEIGQDGPVVMYCQSGARSAQASKFVADNGRERVYNLAGGFSGWVARGFPVVQK
ncbi:MAG TPA: rhodanese-like domain-containing protein [Burkholderiales bacterium]|nr:rhodanese-like domain-containing protein [Burkholderiales bacterium]